MPDPPCRICAYCKFPAIPGQRLCRKCMDELSSEDGPKETGGQKPEAEDLGETSWDSERD